MNNLTLVMLLDATRMYHPVYPPKNYYSDAKIPKEFVRWEFKTPALPHWFTFYMN